MLNSNTSHSTESLTASFLAEEYKRKKYLLARFSLITLFIVLVFSLQSLVYCVLAARWPVGYEAFVIVPFIGCLIAYRQAECRFRLACWCLLGSCLAWVDYTLSQIGTGGNEIVGSMLLIVMAAVLMTSREVVLITFCQALALCGMYLIQNTLGLYQPPYTLGRVVEGTTGAVFALFGIPMLAALVLLPAKGQNRLLRDQNHRLSLLLLEVQARQQVSENVSGEVFSLSNQLKSASSIQAVGSQEQVSSITQVAAALSQLSASASSIATLTLQVSQTAQSVAKESQSLVQSSSLVVSQSKQGVQVVANTTQASEEVAIQYHRLTQQLDELGKRNATSQRILELLSSIAAETRLLSLNAAIEAAGAEQFGERFGVVAGEVKNLAQRSASTSKDVVDILQGIGQVTEVAVQSAQSGFEQTRQMLLRAEQAEKVIAQMSEMLEHSQQQITSIDQAMQEVTRLTHMISTVTFQQHSSIEQIVEALNQLDLLANQNSSQSSYISLRADDLERVSNQLNLSFSETIL